MNAIKTKLIYKDRFAVMGKMGQGSANEPQKWILPIWESANGSFSEIESMACRNTDGTICGLWGAMNDIDEQNERWGSEGKYMAGCEVDTDAVVPPGWAKWIIPAQTYLVAPCTLDSYSYIYEKLTNDENINIVGAVHEHYPNPGNPSALELYIPIAHGMLFCQSCGMPMVNDEDFSLDLDGSKNIDYCHYCFGNGAFFKEETMEEVIESCVPFCIEKYGSEDAARLAMLEFFPMLKRWAR